MRISDWSSDVCSSDLDHGAVPPAPDVGEGVLRPVAVDRTESAGPDAGPGRSRSRREGRNRPRSATRKRACEMKRTKSGARRLAIDVRHVAVMIGAPTLMGALAGCVQIDTPDKAIEINLKINIRQAVVNRMNGDRAAGHMYVLP